MIQSGKAYIFHYQISMAKTFCGADDVTYRIGRQCLIKISCLCYRLQNCSCLKFWPTKTFCLISWSSWRQKRRWTCCSSTCPLVCDCQIVYVISCRDPRIIKQLISGSSFSWAVIGKDYFVYVCDGFCITEHLYTETPSWASIRLPDEPMVSRRKFFEITVRVCLWTECVSWCQTNSIIAPEANCKWMNSSHHCLIVLKS